MSIEELKSVFKVGADLAKFGETALDSHYLGLLMLLPSLFSDLKAIKLAPQAWAEYQAMTDDQALELEDYVVSVVNLNNKTVEAIIEQVFTAVISLHGLISVFKK